MIFPTQHRALSRGGAAPFAFLTVLVLASPNLARADCVAPTADIRWSYPNESTPSIPPDAVFWAVSQVGSVSVEVDGVPLTSRGTGPIERHQFVPAAALAEGEHDLVIQALSQTEGLDDELRDERRIPFRVAAQPRLDASVRVDSVTVYPLSWNTSGALLNPPEDEHDTECSELSTPLEYSCNDLIPQYIARVGYAVEGNAVEGNAVAYLVQGDTIVPPGCSSFWTIGHPKSDPSSFRAAAVLPTGVMEESEFAGPVELRRLEDTVPDRFGKPETCSLGFGQRSPNALIAAAGLALAAWHARRRRR